MSEMRYVTIRNYHDPILAEIVVNALHAAGITTFPLHENNASLTAITQHYEIKVSEKDIESALEIIEEQENL